MSKKKKIKKLAEANIKLLKSGKLKISKGEKISLKPFITDSVENAVVSRLDGIISKEDVVIDTAKLVCDSTTNLTDEIKTLELVSKVQSPQTQTIVLSMTKKQVLNAFNYLNFNTLGILLRTSTLASIYQEIREQWVELNNGDESNFTNVLYIPKIMVFIDFDKGEFRKHPIYTNLLIVATPTPSKMNAIDEAEYSDEDASARVIADTIDAAMKCGCKNLIMNPFSNKITHTDFSLSAGMWHRVTSGERFLEQVDSCIFSIEDEERYIIFNAAKNNIV